MGSIATLMVDFYALPQFGPNAWPGRNKTDGLKSSEKAKHVERALLEDVAAEYGSKFRGDRFVPFVMMYEFEGLLFSDCDAFARGIGQEYLAPALQAIRGSFASPEEINDSPETAPSKRIAAIVNGYEKPLHGNVAVLEIGLASIRAQCPHFNEWLAMLETKAQTGGATGLAS